MSASLECPLLLLPVRLETLFTDTQLLVRIYPDQIAVETHEPELTADELTAGRGYQVAAEMAATEEDRRAAWRELARRFGPQRAAWLVRAVDSYADVDPADLSADSWTAAPKVRLLPDRFFVGVYKGDQLAYSAQGEAVNQPKVVLRDPRNTDSEDLFDAESRWVVDFGRAVDEGMAVSIELDEEDRSPDTVFSRVVAVGVKESVSTDDGKKMLEDLIENHHYTSGFAFLPHGTPTNNTETTESGHSETAEDYDRSFEIEVLGSEAPENGSGYRPTNAEHLSRALGLGRDSPVFYHIAHASEAESTFAEEVQTALWPGTGDSFLRFMLPGVLALEDRRRLWSHFGRWVRARGPFPALRVGNLPYGVLPVTRVSPGSDADPTGWRASAQDSAGEPDAGSWKRFDAALHDVLTGVLQEWRASLSDPAAVPRIGDSEDDPERELLEILGMEAASSSYRVRPFIDERFVEFLLYLLRFRLFGEGTPFHTSDPEKTPKDWIRKWLDEWNRQQKDGAAVVRGLGAPASDVAGAQLFRTVAWGDGRELPVSLVRDPDDPEDTPSNYLSLLCDLGRFAPEGASRTLLFNLLRLSFLWEYPLAKEVGVQSVVRSAICRLSSSTVLEYFNQVTDPAHIVNRIKDDPDFGVPAGYGTTLRVAQRILEERDRLGGRFDSVGQLASVSGVGDDTFHDILFSFQQHPAPGEAALEFLNQATDADEIVSRIRDDPLFGPPPRPTPGITRKVGEKILEERARIGGRFQSLEELARLPGVGADGLHDILFTFRERPAAGILALEFLNQATNPQEIVDRIRDDPNYDPRWDREGYEPPPAPRPRGVARWQAEQILDARSQLGGYFDSVNQLDTVEGVGPDTLHDILFTFQEEPLPDPSEILEYFNEVTDPDGIVQRVRDDPDFGPPKRPSPGVTRPLAEAILARRAELEGGRYESIAQVVALEGVGPDTLHDILSSFWERTEPPEVEGLFRDSLDLCTHRLDAWLVSLATKRLEGMRERKPEGVYLGAYGWVEDLQRREAASDGYIHAPSLGQASAAALLRSGFLSHQDGEGENLFHVNLTSERVRRALRIIDGVREGQELGALLGYQFERGLHDRGNALEQYVDEFREAHPITAHKLTPAEEGEGAEEVAARNVVDGLALSNGWRENEGRKLSQIHEDLPDSGDDYQDLMEELDLLLEGLDGVTDLLMSESVFHTVQGNVERAGAAMDAASGTGRPPEIESVRTSSSGTLFGQRVCVLFSGTPVESPPGSGPRRAAEPRLDAWFGELLGDMQDIACRAYFPRPEEADGGTASLSVSLGDLGIGPLDLLYLSSTPPAGEGVEPTGFPDLASTPRAGEETELERRIAFHVRNEEGLPPDAPVRVDVARGAGDGTRGLGEAVELARHVLALVSKGAALRPGSLCHPEEAGSTSFSADDVETFEDLASRVEDALTAISAVEAELRSVESEEETVTALLEASRFGIQGAIPSSSVDPEFANRKKVVLSQIARRKARCQALRAEADDADSPDHRVNRLIAALQALFGPGFVVMPTFAPVGVHELTRALDQEEIVGPGGEDRIGLWLQQAALTHPAVQRLDDLIMVTSAWSSRPVQLDETDAEESLSLDSGPPMRLRVAQLPYAEDRAWLALSDEEIAEAGFAPHDPADGRPRGVVSVVALSPEGLDPGRVAGLLLDQWSELIPATTLTTGISFHYDQPNTQAPHALLLAVPGQVDRTPSEWTTEDVLGIVNDTLDLAKARTVDLDAFQAVGGLFPALFMSANPGNPGWERETIETLKEWLSTE